MSKYLTINVNTNFYLTFKSKKRGFVTATFKAKFYLKKNPTRFESG